VSENRDAHVVRRRNSAARDTSGEAEGRRFSARNGSVYNGRVPDTVEDSLMMPSLRFACAALALGLATAGHKRSRSRPTAFIACPSQRLYPTTRRLPSAWMWARPRALGQPLQRVSGRPGADIYLAFRDLGGSGLIPHHDRLFLKFRRGRLTGWKQEHGADWMWQ
jgi:hypothetical protein